MADLELIKSMLDKCIGELSGNPKAPTEELALIKSLNHEQQIATEVVYPANTVDAHGHFARPEVLSTLVKALSELPDNFEYNIHHQSDLTTDGFSIIKVYQTTEDMSIDNTGEVILKGSVLADIHYSDTVLWEMKKSGKLGGLSIGCVGSISKTEVEV